VGAGHRSRRAPAPRPAPLTPSSLHLISLQLGGDPNDSRNLRVEPAAPATGSALGGPAPGAGRSGASHPIAVNDALLALLRPTPTRWPRILLDRANRTFLSIASVEGGMGQGAPDVAHPLVSARRTARR
jgi:hypothetical protein